jgi:GH24 family phage-related lysozyme (muramidase)
VSTSKIGGQPSLISLDPHRRRCITIIFLEPRQIAGLFFLEDLVTEQEFLAKTSLYIRDDEGLRLYKYRDKFGVITLGYGEALEGQRPPTFTDQQWASILAAPTAIDSEPENAVAACITQAQAIALFDAVLPGYIAAARASLATGIFDALDDARRYVVIDLTYNMGAGEEGWGGFGATHALIAQAVTAKKSGKDDDAHELFNQVADHLQGSAWYTQTGDRAKRDVAMMRTSAWCNPTGDGSDVL